MASRVDGEQILADILVDPDSSDRVAKRARNDQRA
jgi:hypothetical protein